MHKIFLRPKNSRIEKKIHYFFKVNRKIRGFPGCVGTLTDFEHRLSSVSIKRRRTCFFCSRMILSVPSSEARSTFGMSPRVVKNMNLQRRTETLSKHCATRVMRRPAGPPGFPRSARLAQQLLIESRIKIPASNQEMVHSQKPRNSSTARPCESSPFFLGTRTTPLVTNIWAHRSEHLATHPLGPTCGDLSDQVEWLVVPLFLNH